MCVTLRHVPALALDDGSSTQCVQRSVTSRENLSYCSHRVSEKTLICGLKCHYHLSGQDGDKAQWPPATSRGTQTAQRGQSSPEGPAFRVESKQINRMCFEWTHHWSPKQDFVSINIYSFPLWSHAFYETMLSNLNRVSCEWGTDG